MSQSAVDVEIEVWHGLTCRPEHYSPADDAFDLRVLLQLLLLQTALAVFQPILILLQDLVGLLLLRQKPLLVLLELAMGHLQTFFQRMDLFLILFHLKYQ